MSSANSLLMDNTNSFSSLADTSKRAMEELKGRKGKLEEEKVQLGE